MRVLILQLTAAAGAFAGCSGSSPTWTSAPDVASLQDCINSASPGDTINVSAGTATWNSVTPLTINKALSLNGAGAAGSATSCPLPGGQTNITLAGLHAVVITKQAGVIRLSGFNFTTLGDSSNVPIQVNGAWTGTQPVIVQNNSFCTDGAETNVFDIQVAGGTIFSHNTFVDEALSGCCLAIKAASDKQSWTSTDSIGINDESGILNHYFEDNTVYGGGNGIIDCDDACRIVARYNTFSMSGILTHGQDTSPQGMRHFEIYNNSFLFPDSTCNNGSKSLSNIGQWLWIRGATGVIYNNNFDSLNSSCWGDKPEIRLSIRGAEDNRPQGSCGQVSYKVPHQLGQNFNDTAAFTDPIYLWGNTGNNGKDSNGYIVEAFGGWDWGNPCNLNWNNYFLWGRDGMDTSLSIPVRLAASGGSVEGSGGTPKPGYMAYAHPHPLVSPSAPCSIKDTANCGTPPNLGSGSSGGLTQSPNPGYQSYISANSTALLALQASAQAQPRNRLILSAQLVPASQSYITADPQTCPNSGTCQYNNITQLEKYIDSLLKPMPGGAGLLSIDVNPWLGPMFVTGEYAALCGTNGTCLDPPGKGTRAAAGIGNKCAGTARFGWYCNGLQTYDGIMSYLRSNYPNVLVRISPTPSTPDLVGPNGLGTCSNISTGTTGAAGSASYNYTEAQLQACLLPAYAAFVKRYHVDYFTVIHEPCDVWSLILNAGNSANGCVMTVADTNAFVTSAAAAVRAASQNSAIKIGAGAIVKDDSGRHTCPNPSSFWCDWTLNLMPSNVLDFGAVDIYPSSTASYYAITSGVVYQFQQMIGYVPANKERWVNESSVLRWQPATGGGEAATYAGCGWAGWLNNGLVEGWMRGITSWAASQQFNGLSLFSSEVLIHLSNNVASSRCSRGQDGYDAAAAAAGGSISAEGLMWGQLAKNYAVGP